jgi:cysteine desulfurase
MSIYLDHNATSPLRRVCHQAMMEEYERVGNASAIHTLGREAKKRLDIYRRAVADMVSVLPEQTLFTSGGTEANAMALLGAQNSGHQILCSSTEHDSIRSYVHPDHYLAVNKDGVIDLEFLENQLKNQCKLGPYLVSVMLANNETGVIQPIAQIVEIVKRHSYKGTLGMVHTDATQALGKMHFTFDELGVDYMTLSAHKLGGPNGAGALIFSSTSKPDPLFKGGRQEMGLRAGTENLPAIAGFAALSCDVKNHTLASHTLPLRETLESALQSIAPDITIYGKNAERLPNTSCFSVASLSQESQLMALDLAHIYVSAGAACASRKLHPSHVLLAMGASPESAKSAIRVSFGWTSKPADADQFTQTWASLYNRVQQRYSNTINFTPQRITL